MKEKAIKSSIITTLLIIFACVISAAIIILVQPKPSAHADSNGAASAIAETELSAPTTTYIIGDNSIIGTAGAMPVNNDSDTYGWYTYISATNTYSYSDIEYGWITAINAPSSADSRVKIMLASDWTATVIGTTTDDTSTSFGTNANAFIHGSLYIPSNKYIQLDLNGYVIDRCVIDRTTVTNGAKTCGGVIYVDSNADLELTDSNPTAEHKDGNGNALYTYTDKEVILNEDGTLESADEVEVEITGGIITGGYATYGGGVYVVAGTFTMNGGSITGNSARKTTSSNGGGVYVDNNAMFNMSGGEITGNSAYWGGGGVCSYGIFTMTGGTISGNDVGNSGSGIFLFNGTFTMSGGEITGNSAGSIGGGVAASASSTNNTVMLMTGGSITGNSASNYAGGVYVNAAGCMFTMNGGSISGNSVGAGSYGGGGVYVNGSTFTMNGGSITGNSVASRYGGGVYITGTCTFTMNGGSITGNSTSLYGGGVYVNAANSTFTMNGGSISGNSAGTNGGGVYNLGTFNLSGKPVIKDNKVGDKAHNLYVNSAIKVTGELEEGACIGVNYTASKVATSGYAEYNSVDGYVVDPSEYFFADSDEYGIALSSAGEVLLLSVAWEYKVGYGENAELSVVDGLSVEYGYEKGYEAEYEITNGGVKQSVTVYKDGSDEAYTGSLTQAGEYKLVCNVDSFEVAFTLVITPKDISGEDLGITLNNDYYAYDGSEKEPSIVGTLEYDGETLDYDVTYENNKNAGTAYAVVTLKGNYSGEFKVPFTIDIEGGYYQIVWQYYNGMEWANIDSESEITYVLGLNGDQSNRVRAQLTFAGDESIVKYAYANGVSNYLDSGLSSDEISGYYIEYTLGGVASAFRNAGEYAISIYNDGTETIKLNNNDDEFLNAKTLTVKAFEIAADDEKLNAMLFGKYEFTGAAHTPSVAVVYDNLELRASVDYIVEYYDSEHEDCAILGGVAHARIVFIGNYTGEAVLDFEIQSVVNEWLNAPNFIRWTYGEFDPESSVIIASPKFILDSEMLGVSILDGNGGELVVDGVSLSNITVERVNDVDYGWCYVISDEDVIAAINKLEATRYILRVWLGGTTSYSELGAQEISFNIFKSSNYWDETPSIASWTEGGYGESNLPVASAHFGNDGLRFVIVDVEDETKVYYDSANGINELDGLAAGVYYLTATVAGNDNYTELTYNTMFRVLEKTGDTFVNTGLPWWAILLIVLGALLVAALIIFILNRAGVFQILSEKMVVSIRAKADADATIAAVRAGKYAAAAQVAATSDGSDVMSEKEEKKVIKKAQNLEKKAKTPEEKAAELEAKAKAMRKRAEAMKAKAKVIVMTPEEKKAMRDAEKAAALEKGRVKTPEERADLLERKAELTEEQAAQLKAKAEVMKSRANEMREKAARKAGKDKSEKDTDSQAVAENEATATTTENEEE